MYIFKKGISPVIAVILLLAITVTISMSMYSFLEDYTESTISSLSSNSIRGNVEIKHIFSNNIFLKSENNVNLSLLRILDDSGNELCSFSETDEINSSRIIGHWTFDEVINQSGNLTVEDISGNGLTGILKQNLDGNISTIINSTHIEFLAIELFRVENLNSCQLIQSGNSFNIINFNYSSFSAANIELNSTLGIVLGPVNIVCNQGPQINLGKVFFDGLDDYIEIENSENISIGNQGGINMSFYSSFTFTKGINSYPGFILSKRLIDNSAVTDFSLFFENDKDLIFGTGSAAGSCSWHDSKIRINSLKEQNSVVAIIETINETFGRKKIYLNNKKITDCTYLVKSDSNSNPLIFGRSVNQNAYFKGSIDEIRIYNRSLSETEIEKLYWNLNKNHFAGVSQIDISSCNLEKNRQYNILMIANGEKIESTQFSN